MSADIARPNLSGMLRIVQIGVIEHMISPIQFRLEFDLARVHQVLETLQQELGSTIVHLGHDQISVCSDLPNVNFYFGRVKWNLKLFSVDCRQRQQANDCSSRDESAQGKRVEVMHNLSPFRL